MSDDSTVETRRRRRPRPPPFTVGSGGRSPEFQVEGISRVKSRPQREQTRRHRGRTVPALTHGPRACIRPIRTAAPLMRRPCVRAGAGSPWLAWVLEHGSGVLASLACCRRRPRARWRLPRVSACARWCAGWRTGRPAASSSWQSRAVPRGSRRARRVLQRPGVCGCSSVPKGGTWSRIPWTMLERLRREATPRRITQTPVGRHVGCGPRDGEAT